MIEPIFADCPCDIIADDLLIGGDEDDDHDSNLIKVINTARKNNVKSKASKFVFKLPQVNYMGHLSIHETRNQTRSRKSEGNI
jgi:hypothetical protein